LMSRRFSSPAAVSSDASRHQLATIIAKPPMSAAPLNAPQPAARPTRIRCRFTINKRRDRTVPLVDQSGHRLSCGIRCQFMRSRSRGRAPRVQLLLCRSKLESTVRDLNMKNHELLWTCTRPVVTKPSYRRRLLSDWILPSGGSDLS
jgi:hypothetical protein